MNRRPPRSALFPCTTHFRSLPDGTPYAADDPALLAWVHLTEATGFLDAWIRYAEPGMPAADQDRYLAEVAREGEALGDRKSTRPNSSHANISYAVFCLYKST